MIVRSPYPDVEIPARTLSSYVLELARSHGDRPAYIEGLTGRTLSYTEFVEAVERTAAGLWERGLRKGDVCMLHSPNCLEWPVAYHAILLAGGVVTPASVLMIPDELAVQARDGGASWLFTSPMVLEHGLAAAGKAGIEHIVVFGPAEAAPDGTIAFADLMKSSAPAPDVEIDPLDLAILPYSSGTTGKPKGVMLTHRNLIANVCQLKVPMPVRSGSSMLAVIPISHASGLIAFVHMAPVKALTTVLLPRFDLEWFLSTIQNYAVNNAVVAPPIVLALAKHPLVDQYDLSSLEILISAAAPLKEDLARACEARLNCRIIQAYGMTELSPTATIMPLTHDKPASIGPAIPNTEMKIVDVDTGAVCGINERGEIWVRGPQVMKGYLNRPEATAETITDDGWLKTGDIGYVDEDGLFYIVDRVKELIKYKAHQVAPAELEDVLVSHPAIADAAVIGVPDEETGELPKAFIVRSGEVTAQEIMDFVAGRVAPYKRIRLVEFVDEIPKAPTGKILRRVLIERERGLVPA